MVVIQSLSVKQAVTGHFADLGEEIDGSNVIVIMVFLIIGFE